MPGLVENIVMVRASLNTGMMFSQSCLMNYLDIWQDDLEGTVFRAQPAWSADQSMRI